MKILIESVSHSAQRYDTIGDWQETDDGFVIRVSDHLPQSYQMLVAVHELVEAILCRARGITDKDVDEFDMSFKGDGEPGDSLDSPYRLEHRFAMLIEHLLAHELGETDYGEVR